MELVIAPDAAAAAVEAADRLAAACRAAIAERSTALLAVSGGSTAPPMLERFFAVDGLDWSRVTIWQVDERIEPDGDPSRNLGQLANAPCSVAPMPVTASDLPAAAADYDHALPDRFDVVHLGLGDDGHTASWPPDPHPDAARAASDRGVEVVHDFNGHDRMTLTARVVNGARMRLLLTTGPSKAPMVERWLLIDPTIPAGRLRRTDTLVVVDSAAAAGLRL